jgi:hypothetical protein
VFLTSSWLRGERYQLIQNAGHQLNDQAEHAYRSAWESRTAGQADGGNGRLWQAPVGVSADCVCPPYGATRQSFHVARIGAEEPRLFLHKTCNKSRTNPTEGLKAFSKFSGAPPAQAIQGARLGFRCGVGQQCSVGAASRRRHAQALTLRYPCSDCSATFSPPNSLGRDERKGAQLPHASRFPTQKQ